MHRDKKMSSLPVYLIISGIGSRNIPLGCFECALESSGGFILRLGAVCYQAKRLFTLTTVHPMIAPFSIATLNKSPSIPAKTGIVRKQA